VAGRHLGAQSRAARVDQMQLGQPIKGAHPAGRGASTLATSCSTAGPPLLQRGIFLPRAGGAPEVMPLHLSGGDLLRPAPARRSATRAERSSWAAPRTGPASDRRRRSRADDHNGCRAVAASRQVMLAKQLYGQPAGAALHGRPRARCIAWAGEHSRHCALQLAGEGFVQNRRHLPDRARRPAQSTSFLGA
jgi:hypothetical protein